MNFQQFIEQAACKFSDLKQVFSRFLTWYDLSLGLFFSNYTGGTVEFEVYKNNTINTERFENLRGMKSLNEGLLDPLLPCREATGPALYCGHEILRQNDCLFAFDPSTNCGRATTTLLQLQITRWIICYYQGVTCFIRQTAEIDPRALFRASGW